MAEGGWLGLAIPEEYGGGGRGHHRRRGHAPRDRRERRGDERLLGRAPHRVRAQPGGEVRQRPPQGDVPPPRRRRRPARRVRRHRTRRRHRHRSHHHPRRARRQRAAGASTAARSGPARRSSRRWCCSSRAPATPTAACKGLSLFLADLDPDYVDIRPIPKVGRNAVASCEVAYDGLPVESWRLLGEENEGFRLLLHGLNPERVLLASEACGIGEVALDRADHLRQGTDRVRPSDRRQPGDQPSPRARRMRSCAPRG